MNNIHMNNKIRAGLALVAALLFVAGPAFGHHNTAGRYDDDNHVTLVGTVTQFRMINPHSLLLFAVQQEDGAVVEWHAEGGSPSAAYRRGWRTDDFKPGDSITVTGAPARDGRHYLIIRKLVTPSGKELR